MIEESEPDSTTGSFGDFSEEDDEDDEGSDPHSKGKGRKKSAASWKTERAKKKAKLRNMRRQVKAMDVVPASSEEDGGTTSTTEDEMEEDEVIRGLGAGAYSKTAC